MSTKKDYTISIPAFPHDDDKEYIIRNFGLIRKNPSPAASVYLVEVFIESLDTGEKLTIETILTHLLVVRIGTVWKNQKLVHKYYSEERNGFEKRMISFSLNNAIPPSIKLLVGDKTIGKKRIIGIDELNHDEDEVLSVFTVFTAVDGTQVFIPSLEILLSTYTPKTHTILHDTVVLPIDDVVKKHVRDCTIEGENNDIYNADFKSNYFIGTKFFLAYLSCNNNTRRNVSKIRSSLMNNQIMRGKRRYSFLEVFPYHPDEFNVKALGLYDEKNKRFWVHQIRSYDLPSCCYVPYEKQEKAKKKTYQKTQRKLNNEDVVIDDLDLVNNIDAGRNAGKKYIKSEVDVNIHWDKVYDTNTTTKESAALTGEIKPSDPIAAAASPLSGQNASKPIAAVEYRDTPKENHLKVLLDAIKKLNKEMYFLIDNADRKEHLVFCSLPKKRTFEGRRSNWAFISKDRPRKLLVCEICLPDKFVYILDIERKNKDTYVGIIFSSTNRMDHALLRQIKDVISINQGRFGGDKKRKKFPVDNYKAFRHYSEKIKMENSIRSLIDKV